MFWQKHKIKIIAACAALVVLAAAFWWGGNAPGLQGWSFGGDNSSPGQIAEAEDNRQQTNAGETAADNEQTQGDAEPGNAGQKPDGRPGGETPGTLTADEKMALAESFGGGTQSSGNESYSEAQGMKIDPATGKDKYQTDPVPEGKPIPVEPQDAVISDKELTCTISISCATILDNMSWLDPEKTELVPEDGWILPPITATFYEGESVFNLLSRVTRQQGIHMEFSNTPMYNSAYIEGINNLYEFDCGDLSGWMYKVNDWFPNYGCSRYQLKAGDVVEWVYTCTLGGDVGGADALGG